MRREKLKNLSKNGQNATDVVQFLLDNRKHFRLVLRSLTANLLSSHFCHYLDVLHCAFEWIDCLGHELQPVGGSGVEGPHPGRLGVGCGRSALLRLRLIGKVVLILQHLHFQHLTHHVNACAARQREQSERGRRWKTRPWWEVGGEEINSRTKKQITYPESVLI